MLCSANALWHIWDNLLCTCFRMAVRQESFAEDVPRFAEMNNLTAGQVGKLSRVRPEALTVRECWRNKTTPHTCLRYIGPLLDIIRLWTFFTESVDIFQALLVCRLRLR